MTNFQKLIGVSALIISIALAYYFVVAIPNRDKLKQDLLQNQVDERDKCLRNVMSYYSSEWDRACEIENQEPKCVLNSKLGIYYNKMLQDQQEHCIKLYPSN